MEYIKIDLYRCESYENLKRKICRKNKKAMSVIVKYDREKDEYFAREVCTNKKIQISDAGIEVNKQTKGDTIFLDIGSSLRVSEDDIKSYIEKFDYDKFHDIFKINFKRDKERERKESAVRKEITLLIDNRQKRKVKI